MPLAHASGPATSIAVWQPPAGCAAIDFISDLHVSVDTPRTFDALAQYLRQTSADAVLLLGDVFEVWVGDDARHEAFERNCVELFREASQRLTLAFMAGNRDFLLGAAMLEDSGLQGLSDPTVIECFGQRALVTHGDALCLADADYQQFRRLVRSDLWQRGFLAQSLEQRWTYARSLRAQSEARKRAGADPNLWADVDEAAARQWLAAAQASVLVHGHTHRPCTEPFAGGTRHVLSDWDLDHAPHRADVLRWSAQGFERLSLDAALGR
jgi:UDP-2,3-diacylglucosamine hydrolase